jgi:ribonuclease-3
MGKQDKYDDMVRGADGSLIYHPYHTGNREITQPEVEALLKRYGVKQPIIQSFALYLRAFVHQSYTKPQAPTQAAPAPVGCLPLRNKSNQRLEFLGDGVLECVIKNYLYRRFPRADEKFMTEKKIAVVKNETIGRIAFEMGLHTWLLLSRKNEEKKIRTNFKSLGCLFEAFVGALFLDSDFLTAQQFIEKVLDDHIDWVDIIQTDDNYKNLLQVRLQKEFRITPHYVSIRGTLHQSTSSSSLFTTRRKRGDSEGTTTSSSDEDDIGGDEGDTMAVYLCVGQPPYYLRHEDSVPLHSFANLQAIHDYVAVHGKVYVCLGQGTHKIKKKAEQRAAWEALQSLH